MRVQTRLENKCRQQGEWLGPRNSQVVGRTVNGERTDRTTRKRQRTHHETVGGERQLLATDLDHRRVIERSESGVGENWQEQPFDQAAAGLAARTVGHLDPSIAKTEFCHLLQPRMEARSTACRSDSLHSRLYCVTITGAQECR